MAIKQISINNEILNIDELVKVRSDGNIFINTDNFNTFFNFEKSNLNVYDLDDPNNYWNTSDEYKWNEGGLKVRDTQHNQDIGLFICGANKSDRTTYAIIRAVKPNPVYTYAQMSIAYHYITDTFQTHCITPDINSNTDNIATTAWVRQLLTRNGINLTS